MKLKRVFLSHNPYISQFLAIRLAHLLQSPQLKLTMVLADWSYSTPPPNKLYEDWVTHSDVVITILTPATFTGGHINNTWFWRELELAINLHIPIMTILAYGARFPETPPPQIAPIFDHLKSHQFLKLKGEQQLEEELKLLHATLMAMPLPRATAFGTDSLVFEQALQDTIETLAIPTDQQLAAEEHLNSGLVAANSRKFEAASELFTQAIDLYPDYYNAYNSRAVSRAIMGDFDAALSDLSHCISQDGKNFRAYSNRGNVYMRLGKSDDALLDYSKAIDLSPHSSYHYNNRGFARYNAGDFDGAVRDCTEAIRINPQAADAYDSRGFSHFALGDYDSALQDFQHVLQIQPDYIESMAGLAISYQALGDKSAARKIWKEFVGSAGTEDLTELAERFVWTPLVKDAVEKVASIT